MSIMDYNGGSVVAMVGKECVAIACDLRLGNQALGVANDFEKVCVCIRPITVYMSVECRQVDQRDGLGSNEDVMFTHMENTSDLSHSRQDVPRPPWSRDGRLHAVRTPSLVTFSPPSSSLHHLLSHSPQPSSSHLSYHMSSTSY
jgi:hypothetical protein